jgi:uncharacterized membrane protein
MNYNIHPILVHFPVGFLIIYSLIKILPLSSWFPRISWKHIEVVLLVVGFGGALAADSSGELAEHLAKPNGALVEMHSLFAATSTWIYGILLGGEVSPYVRTKIIDRIRLTPVSKLLTLFETIVLYKGVSFLLALLGLIAISVTGLLGGVMVYGVTADPIAPMVLKILGIPL